MTALTLTERVRSYLARQHAWLERETAAAERLLEQAGNLPDLDDPLAAAKTSMAELEDLEREQRGLLAEWRDENIPPEERESIHAESERVAEMAATLSVLRGRVAQAIAEGQASILVSEQSLRAGRGGLRRYRPGMDSIADHIDRNA